MDHDTTGPGGDGQLAEVIEFPLWRRRVVGPPESARHEAGRADVEDLTDGIDGSADTWDDGADIWTDEALADDSGLPPARADRGSACMAELVAMMTADGADVVAFARSLPARFRPRLPADLRLAAGFGADAAVAAAGR
jgi:hypothetical protein